SCNMLACARALAPRRPRAQVPRSNPGTRLLRGRRGQDSRRGAVVAVGVLTVGHFRVGDSAVCVLAVGVFAFGAPAVPIGVGSVAALGLGVGVLAVGTFRFAVQFLELLLGPGKFFRKAPRFPLSLLPFSQAFRASLGPLLLALLLAGLTFATDRLQIRLEVVGSIVVVDFVARRDVLDRADENLSLARANVAFSVRLAGMIDIAGDVLAHRAVDGPAIVELEQIFVLDRVILLLPGIQQRPEIPDDLGPLLDRLGGEEAEPGAGTADAIGFLWRNGRHSCLTN